MFKKILIAAASVLVIAGTALLFTKSFMHLTVSEADVSAGRALLSEQNEQDISTVEQEIQQVQFARDEAARQQREAEEAALRAQHEAEAAALAAAAEAEKQVYFELWSEEANAMADADQFKGIFSNSMTIGDSIVEGILDCDLMLPANVLYKIGGNVEYNFMNFIPDVQSFQPDNIFLYVGFNDMGIYYGDKEKYYNSMVTFISQLQAACPGVPIYWSEIIPVISTEFLESEEYWKSAEYNQIIRQVCDEYGVTFIPTNDLVKQEFYYKDGYHMIYPYYPLWLRRMAEYSGLM